MCLRRCSPLPLHHQTMPMPMPMLTAQAPVRMRGVRWATRLPPSRPILIPCHCCWTAGSSSLLPVRLRVHAPHRRVQTSRSPMTRVRVRRYPRRNANRSGCEARARMPSGRDGRARSWALRQAQGQQQRLWYWHWHWQWHWHPPTYSHGKQTANLHQWLTAALLLIVRCEHYHWRCPSNPPRTRWRGSLQNGRRRDPAAHRHRRHWHHPLALHWHELQRWHSPVHLD